MPYGNSYTWAKYGHFILHNGIIPSDNSAAGSDDESPETPYKHSMADNMNSLTVNHRDCLISFLRTDPDSTASFIVDASSTRLIDEFDNNFFDCWPKELRKDTILMRSLSKIQILQSRAFVSLRRRPPKFHCQFSQIYSTISLRKRFIWNQRCNYCSSST